MTQPSPSQQGVWICGRPSSHHTRLPLMKPSTYPCPTIVTKGGTLTQSRWPITKS